MTLDEFVGASDLLDQTEIEKTRLLAFFHLRVADLISFNSTDIQSWFDDLHLGRPNMSRLTKKLRASRMFVQGNSRGDFKLHAREIAELDGRFPEVAAPGDAVVSADTILPSALYQDTRGYIESLAKQINASYEHNIFDGCAVLMRRLLEIVLILTYQHQGLESLIKQGDRFVGLEKIIGNAKASPVLALSKDSKDCLDDFRKLGNFSAHKIHYTCKRDDIRRVALEYRVAVEELLYKAGIRT